MLINGLRFEVAILRHVRRRFFCDVGCAPPIIFVPLIPSFPAKEHLEYTYWKEGGAYPLFITVIHSTECSAVAVVAGGK